MENNTPVKTYSRRKMVRVIVASSAGAVIEWYDFFIFGSLAALIGKKLFPADAGESAIINTLAIFAVGFIVRPFGSIFFGRLGDLLGRKSIFMLTLALMGIATVLVGCVPDYQTIGYAAPISVLILRVIQGLALGGESGGAAVYVAEHAPKGKIGFFTSWIQTTATLGMFISLIVVMITKEICGVEIFERWGWRIPFLLSGIMVGITAYIRLHMEESPVYAEIKASGNTSKNPLIESFVKKENLKIVLLAIFGATMGQGAVWYTGQFYVQNFLESTCHLSFNESRYILILGITFATPFFVIFAMWSDKVGRKWIIMSGLFLSAIFYRPVFSMFLQKTNVAELKKTMTEKRLSEEAVTYTTLLNLQDTLATHKTRFVLSNGMTYTELRVDTILHDAGAAQPIILKGNAKYIDKELGTGDYILFVALTFSLIFFITLAYGPISAFLVELFPSKIRYTSWSLPSNIGNGAFGGLVPFMIALINSTPGATPLTGLWLPICFAGLCCVIGSVFINPKFKWHQ